MYILRHLGLFPLGSGNGTPQFREYRPERDAAIQPRMLRVLHHRELIQWP